MVEIDRCEPRDEVLGLCIPKKGRVRLIRKTFRVVIGRDYPAVTPQDRHFVPYAITNKAHRFPIAKAVDGNIYNTHMEAIIPMIEVDERLSEQEKERIGSLFLDNLERYSTLRYSYMGEWFE